MYTMTSMVDWLIEWHKVNNCHFSLSPSVSPSLSFSLSLPLLLYPSISPSLSPSFSLSLPPSLSFSLSPLPLPLSFPIFFIISYFQFCKVWNFRAELFAPFNFKNIGLIMQKTKCQYLHDLILFQQKQILTSCDFDLPPFRVFNRGVGSVGTQECLRKCQITHSCVFARGQCHKTFTNGPIS